MARVNLGMNWNFHISRRSGHALSSQSSVECLLSHFATRQGGAISVRLCAAVRYLENCHTSSIRPNQALPFGAGVYPLHLAPRLLLLSLLALSLLVYAPASWSQDQGAAINIGEAKLYPSATISYISNDNIFASREALVESNGVKVEPVFLYVADKGGNGFELGYTGSYLKSDISAADYADHQLFLSGLAKISSRSQLSSNLAFTAGHYDFGGIFSRGEVSRSLSETYQYNEVRFNTQYRYGAQRAKGNAILGLTARKRSHTNEPDSDLPNRTDGLNFTSVVPYVVFSLRVSGDTRAFVDLRFGSSDYDSLENDNAAQLDNDRFRAYIGTSWDISGRSGGSIKVGSINTSFDDARRTDNQIVGFELDAFYSLRQYSKITIGLVREQDSVTGSQLLGRSDTLDLNWRHDWSTRFNSAVGIQYETTFSECIDDSDVADRENNDLSLSGDLNYKFRRWLSLGVGYSLDNGESSICIGEDDRDFERSRINAHMIVTL